MKLGIPPPPSPVATSRNVPGDQASYAGLVPGDTLDGRFLLIEELSRGGMATVFKAEDLANQRQLVAVKVPHATFASGIGSWSRFERETEIGQHLDHPFILKFLPGASLQRSGYVVTEYLHGETLADRLARGERLTETEALTLTGKVCNALQYLHEHGVVHADLKPGNIMLCADGSVRLIDFGMAQPIETGRFHLFSSAPAMGTTDYIAPEQLQHKHGRPSADIYSLGALLYELLTGSVAFPGDDPYVLGSVRLTGDPVAPRKLNPAISPQAEEIVLRALQRDPARRYPTAAAMHTELAAPAHIQVTGLCDHLQPSTRWRRALRITRWIAGYCFLPFALLLLAYLLIWLHFSGKH